jgi:hypothetical protein
MYVCVYLVYYYIKYSRQGEGGKKYTLACSTTTTTAAGRRDWPSRDLISSLRTVWFSSGLLVLY